MAEVTIRMQEISMLNSICKTTQMGVWGIDAVKKEAGDRQLLAALDAQQQEYRNIHAEADRLLRERGRTPERISSMTRQASTWSARLRARVSNDPDAKIAEMTLQGNTRGMIKSMHNLRTLGVIDPKVSTLSNRLLQTEQANIEEMKKYL